MADERPGSSILYKIADNVVNIPDCSSQVTTYDLVSVICHHGTAGGGHYTAYGQNYLSEQWYEYDDQTVSEVDPGQVACSQAYVLFYSKKQTLPIVSTRQKAVDLMDADQKSLMRFFVSKQWVNRFNTFSEPGPISNHDFLCQHGGIPPNKMAYIDKLVQPFSQTVWEYMHDRFGGGPPCSHLFACETCQNEAQALKKRQSSELDQFIKFNEAFQEEENPMVIYAVSMAWFKDWEAFAKGTESDAPGPIDNSTLSLPYRPGHVLLNRNSNYGQLSKAMWNFLYEIYGGGPELIVKEEVSPTEGQGERIEADSVV